MEPFALQRTLVFQKGFFWSKWFLDEPDPSAEKPFETLFFNSVGILWKYDHAIMVIQLS
jgi:hypothetical protein